MSSNHRSSTVAAEVIAALEADRLDLPVLPDIAIRIRDSLTNPNASLERLVHVVSSDPVLAVHVIKAANSSAFHGSDKVNSLRGAISRIGYRMLYGIVMNVALIKLFRARHAIIDRHLRKAWRRSCEVAANCYVLAERDGHLQPEVAMLAGLVHQIGVLPLCMRADEDAADIDQAALDGLMHEHAASIGVSLLQHWNFPDDVVEIVAGHADPAHVTRADVADYVDVLELAIRLSAGQTDSWRNLHAAERLGFYPGDRRNFFSSHADEIAEMQGLLGIAARRPARPAPAAQQRLTPALLQAEHGEAGWLHGLARFFKSRTGSGSAQGH
jgi:HD-like signal output (HDOD) protein